MEIALDRFTGFSKLYDEVRPKPPKTITELALALSLQDKFELVLDLGSGTGLSSTIWENFSSKVIGLEPNEEMRNISIKNYKNIKFIDGNSYSIPLEKESCDIICCSQSFHWMEPESTLKEVNRILKKGGLFIVYDCDWPVTIHPEAELAYFRLFSKINELHDLNSKILPIEKKWSKNNHYNNIFSSGYFSYVRNLHIHNEEECDSERFIGIALSQGHLQTLLKNRVSGLSNELINFENVVRNSILKEQKMWISYDVIIGKKLS